VTAVYKELLKEYQPQNIGIFGTSAGGILTTEATVKFKALGLPLPGALGLFTMMGDFSNPGDSLNLFTLNGFPGDLEPHHTDGTPNEYAGKTDLKDAVLSPLYADLRGMPPTLLVTSTRDLLLSGTTIFHRALLRAGNDTQLVVFEALPHAFWYHFELPETQECLQMMAKFFDQKLRR
jgi:epsilon-lactone hydrolase